MNFTAFDSSKLDEYSKKAKEQWGQTPEYKEFTEKSKNWTKEYEAGLMNDFMKIVEEFGTMKDLDPAAKEVQAQVKKVQDFITENMYTCSNDILKGLGAGYAAGGEFTENIDKMGGAGTAEFIYKAILIYCDR